MEAAPTAQATCPSSFRDLPPVLLGKIFVLTGSAVEIGPSVTLVCHAWRDVFYSEPALWSSFRLRRPSGPAWALAPPQQHAQWLAAKRALLKRVAPLVTAVYISAVDRLQAAAQSVAVEQFFGLLQPAALESLNLNGWTSLPPGLLARFSNLRSLSLWQCSCNARGSWAPAVLEAVCSMPQLTSLFISTAAPPPNLLAAIAQRLPQLRALNVASREPLRHAEQLTALAALQDLELKEEVRQGGCLRPPMPARLPNLERYSFVPANGRKCQYPGGLLSLAKCSALHAEHGISMELWGVEQLTCLHSLLDAMAPPAGAPLIKLRLTGQLDAAPAAAALPAGSAAARQLASLQQLTLTSVRPANSILPLLQAVLPCTGQQLSWLELQGDVGPQLAQCVVQLRGLRQLVLRSPGLIDLPDGPYLQELEQLDVQGTSVDALPALLPATLANLRLPHGLALVAADVNCLLSLPCLSGLALNPTLTQPALLERLQQAPRLRLRPYRT